MNIPEAIKVLEQDRSDHHSFPTDIIGQAEQLAIEALEDFKRHRGRVESGHYRILPSETED